MAGWLAGISLFWGKVFAVAFFVDMIVWTWFRPRKYIYEDSPDENRWRDLRIWATVVLGIQVVLYIVF